MGTWRERGRREKKLPRCLPLDFRRLRLGPGRGFGLGIEHSETVLVRYCLPQSRAWSLRYASSKSKVRHFFAESRLHWPLSNSPAKNQTGFPVGFLCRFFGNMSVFCFFGQKITKWLRLSPTDGVAAATMDFNWALGV
jgi:hypothetical protein